MALITCSECGNTVSDKASSCPKCGAPIFVPDYTAPPPPPEKGPSFWPWAIGVVVVGFLMFTYLGSSAPSGPPARKTTDASAIALCWQEQGRKSLSPEAARFAASTCENMEDEFRRIYGHKP